MADHCEVIVDPDTGEILGHARIGDDIDDEGRTHLVALLKAARRLGEQMSAEEHAAAAGRQAAAIERIRKARGSEP